MKKSIAAFAFLFLPFLAAAQPVKTPVSAADPYGVDFSKVSGNVVQITEYKGNDVDSLSVRSITTYEDRRPQEYYATLSGVSKNRLHSQPQWGKIAFLL